MESAFNLGAGVDGAGGFNQCPDLLGELQVARTDDASGALPAGSDALLNFSPVDTARCQLPGWIWNAGAPSVLIPGEGKWSFRVRLQLHNATADACAFEIYMVIAASPATHRVIATGAIPGATTMFVDESVVYTLPAGGVWEFRIALTTPGVPLSLIYRSGGVPVSAMRLIMTKITC